MLNQLRTYRVPTRLLAVVLWVASVLPYVGHVCMMAESHDMPVVKQCCCDEMHSRHEGMEEMLGTQCKPENPFQIASTSGHVVSLAPVNHLSIGSPGYPRFQTGLLKDLGPPPLSTLSLHILYAHILN